ncbi:restriction endonuclease subunit S [Xanthomonas oryzae pv. oryzae]|uniref:restriction endonuclease subunit S n=1 Tax=Xanthomonas oryzae TaxID=347 RepID=UPI000DE0F3E2|nr:restriction endonuclease subunit S [Xanthomonas oryzae]UAD92109.1 restriction endonuclease subunit S [Xanthomonas oryzae pv. oryzae]UHC70963.1 restriction endonuclease subunit S [Xanthomonas oryzae pv. oryzae]URJ81352.1 restriction endonuclease subunit S [Xanthomonas oryzae pv. oryzae]WEE93790.1 restriction endonuclease subunit S [Xanthomonas oryzae]
MLSAKNISGGKIRFDELRLLSKEDFELEDRRTNISPDDVLLTIVGALGRSAVVPSESPEFTVQRSVAVLKTKHLEPNYLRFLLESPIAQRFFQDNAKGTAQKGIYLKALGSMPIVVAPLAEQKRIAQKLDALLAQVDTLKARIDAIPGLLKRFRQGVLASAITGSLTGVALTATIQLSEVGEITGGITKNAKRTSFKLSVPYLRVANVQAGYLDLTEVHDIGVSPAEAKKTALTRGDILIVEGNGSLEHIGRAATWRGEIDGCCHQNHLIRWRSNGAALPEFVMIYLSSPQGRSDLMKVAKSTTGLHTLSISKISSVRLPVADMEQQQAIVRRVEQLFAYADQLEAKVAAAQQRIDALTQSLLAKAFRGELVPQDPSDEPASALLDRIRAQRAATPKPKRGRKAATS